MVSPPPSSSNPAAPSYAERAKKAQNIKPINSAVSQRPRTQVKAAENSPASILSNPSLASSANASDAALAYSIVEAGLTSSAGLPFTHPPSSPTHPLSDESGAQSTNGDVASHSSTSTAPSSAPSQSASAKSAPVVNVWNQRKNHMAQARTQSRPLQSISQNTVQASPRPSSPPRHATNGGAVASGSRPPSEPAPVINVRPQKTGPSPGAKLAPENSSEDAFVVRARRMPSGPSQPAQLPPPVDDVESWPEVGKSVSSPTSRTQPIGRASSAEEKEERGKKDEEASSSVHPATARKSEKTKWVVIPPEELQASADAYNSSQQRSNPHSRNHSQRNSPKRNQSRGNIVSGAASLQGSQVPSKAPSVRTSTTHSRIQSPVGSVQSSPQNFPRGRRLPADDPAGWGAQSGPSNVLEPPSRPSQGNSPRVYADTTFAAPVPSASIHKDVYSFGTMPGQPGNTTTYYIPPPPLSHPSPNQAHNPYPPTSSSSPFHQSYALHTPPNGYVNPPPLQQSYSGTPPYTTYPPYGYPYAQPYVYYGIPPRYDMTGPSQYAHYTQMQPSPVAQPSADVEVEGTLPPPTRMARPPPPQVSNAVAGYRDVGTTQDVVEEDDTRGRLGRDVVFGSIGVPGASQIPSPAPPPPDKIVDSERPQENKESGDRPIMFSIGVAPGEPGPLHGRSRTRSHPRLRAEDGSVSTESQQHTGEVQVIDLTDPETKWEFGTTKQIEAGEGDDVGSLPAPDFPSDIATAPGHSFAPLGPGLLFSGSLPQQQPYHGGPMSTGIDAQLSDYQHRPLSLSSNGLQLQTGVGPYGMQPPSAQPLSGSSIDEWEVRDYGYGFGRGSGTGNVPTSSREERLARERDWNRGGEREQYVGRPRRGSYSGYAERGGYMGERGGFEPRGAYEPRSNFNGRRGRGSNGGYGRGYTSRGFSRGGGYHNPRQPPPLPFNVTPPAPVYNALHPPTPPQTEVNQYFPPPFVPQGYEAYQYQQPQAPYVPAAPPPPPPAAPQPAPPAPGPGQAPPIPRPLSNISFPLDLPRYYLLGQLEYYLSSQNLAQDFYLRQKMDSRGWIPIQLLASFNRVKQFTTDPHMVREVLSLSLVVEVRDDHVRMGGGEWQQFVLPDAAASTVEPAAETHDDPGVNAEGEGEEEDEEDEDEVEFVMGREVGQPWVTNA
ncbi:hypothetical protein BV25DRAFT_1819791 [Artomyces pyxidatus]|uniref:Uncharacterized protein n=1 Tax=Artomyces pyxidatus TaxID=48021 RepID=A0ACB8TGC7_9AGAM|nr:hypothetical protein BV25DRAFT_1819791 [Artomyces pyxidatus]